MAEFPYDETRLVDPESPADGDLAATLDDKLRETRRALNYLYERSSDRAYREVELEPLATTVALLGDKVLVLTAAEADQAVAQFTGGYEGQLLNVVLADDSPDLTIHHNASYISLADSQDFIMKPGDLLCLRNLGGDPDSETDGSWREAFRAVNGAILAMVSPDTSRFAVTVSDQGALQVEEL